MSIFGRQNRTLLAATALALGVLLGGCGGSSDTPTTTTPPAVDAAGWMDQFCSAVGNVTASGSLKSLNRLNPANLAEVKQTLIDHQRAYDVARDALGKIGPSPVKSGDAAVGAIKDLLEKVRAVVVKASDSINAAGSASTSQVSSILRTAQTEGRAASEGLGKGLDDSELEAKGAGVPSCQKIGMTPRASTPKPSI